ncbi:hypothetical protein ACH5RR_023813 [Cinchona calisaya]|uniref:F-box associated domain-containing protein n=1 Tax=Cinchona calisaya TaxID=153742 RepID=A0ABD2ZDL0_9GENT
MQIELLPSIGDGWVEHFHLAYILQTGQYMVVCLFKNFGIFHGLVLTLGINDLWRKLKLPRDGRNLDGLFHATSIVVGHVVYLSSGDTELVAVNLHDETSCFIQLPFGNSYRIYWENLSCLVREDLGMNVYVLRDSTKCEWDKVCHISDVITRQKIPVVFLLPLGWLDNGRIIILDSKLWSFRDNFIIAVNIETGDAKHLSFSNDVPIRHILIHANSLVKWQLPVWYANKKLERCLACY